MELLSYLKKINNLLKSYLKLNKLKSIKDKSCWINIVKITSKQIEKWLKIIELPQQNILYYLFFLRTYSINLVKWQMFTFLSSLSCSVSKPFLSLLENLQWLYHLVSLYFCPCWKMLMRTTNVIKLINLKISRNVWSMMQIKRNL